ncbi:hypothetical protein FQA39_LY07497 [Lamprigera yunnana]|nr:hypothetical protein FQA39_LY07497 [Lamprigera yunnana]
MKVLLFCFLNIIYVFGVKVPTGNTTNKNSLNIGNKYGDTPLHLSIFRGYHNITRLLISAGADVDVKNENGNTPLHYAVIYKNILALRLLLEKNANPNVVNQFKETPLYLTVVNNQFESSKLLVKYGAMINTTDKSPTTAAIVKDRVHIMKIFLDIGININEKFDNSYLITKAIQYGANKITRLLIESGADLSVKNDNDESLLYSTIYSGNLELAELIINQTSIKEDDVYPDVY